MATRSLTLVLLVLSGCLTPMVTSVQRAMLASAAQLRHRAWRPRQPLGPASPVHPAPGRDELGRWGAARAGLDGAAQLSLHGLPVSIGAAPGPLSIPFGGGLSVQAFVPIGAGRFGYLPTFTFSVHGSFGTPPPVRRPPPAPAPRELTPLPPPLPL